MSEKTDKEVREFFENLGYTVLEDGRYRYGEIWHEIYSKDGLEFQIDKGVPLSVILEDFESHAKGKTEGTSGYDYQCNGSSSFCRKILKNVGKVVENKDLL